MNKYEIQQNETILTARANIQPPELDEAAARRLLNTINAKHARTPLSLEDVYIFPGSLSTQAIDFYGTRMAPRSMRNYKADVKAGIALMNSHRTGGWGETGELPVGRIFEGELTGDELKPGEAGFDEQIGLSLDVWNYMLRGIKVTDVANDDLIQAIDGGTTRDMSISFSPHPDGKFICSICGKDYLAWNDDPEQRCSHLAFVNYDEGEGESQRCFVWVENAHAFEGSLVYKGATPGAMVRKAQFYAPQLAKEQIGWLEERYQVRLLDASVHPAAQLELDETPPTEDRGDAEKEARMRAKITETIKARLGEQRAAELMAIEDDIQFTAESLRALTEAHEVAILQLEADSIALEARIAELTPNAELGAAYKADLVAEVVKARVQAQGSEFDAEMYRKVLMSQSDLAFIKSERATWQERAAEAFKSGRQFRLEEPQKPVRAPLAAYSG